MTSTESEETPLSSTEKEEGYILTCVRYVKSDVQLEAENLGVYGLKRTRTIPAKIQALVPLTPEILKVTFRLPPTRKLEFLEGQYLNVIRGGIKRSYSIASSKQADFIELFIKNYEGGKMSAYWFEDAKLNDLVRLEIPHGTFFLRNHKNKKQLVFVATGTGIAPIKAILESPENLNKLRCFDRVIVLWGMRYEKDLFWKPNSSLVEFFPVLSREYTPKKYVQDVISDLNLDFPKAVVYACGADEMIKDTKAIVINKGLDPKCFFSDAFVASN